MKKTYLALLLPALLAVLPALAQKDAEVGRKPDIVSLGLGLGYDFGGIGANILVYPQKNIGLFFGGGYAIAGFGYNAGVKIRFLMDRPHVVMPYFMAMYGYNAAVAIINSSQYNKLFYGPSFAAGIDLRSRKPSSKGYMSAAITVPIRTPDAQNYIDNLQTNYGASFATHLSPVGFSIGYHFILY